MAHTMSGSDGSGGSRQTVSSVGTTRSTMTETPSPAATAPARPTLLGPVKTISQSRPARSSASIDSFVSTHSSSWATSGTGPADRGGPADPHDPFRPAVVWLKERILREGHREVEVALLEAAQQPGGYVAAHVKRR